jgi:hypothetical protein
VATWMGIETVSAWILAALAAAIGGWMVATGMLEELIAIVRERMRG